jgi:Delta3-Delta2-enoyl-CoA isomerase
MIAWEETPSAVIVSMPAGQNQLNPDFMMEMQGVLDRVEQDTSASVLILTSADGKFFSSGLDVDWMTKALAINGPRALEEMFHVLGKLYRRFLAYPLITIAAINGHAFAAGAVLACACDFRIMNRDRGFFCLPEIDLGVPLLPSALALLRNAMPAYLFDDLLFSGRRLGGAEAAGHHLVREACPGSDLLARARTLAAGFQKDRTSIGEMKRRVHDHIIDLINRADPLLIGRTTEATAGFLERQASL